MVTEAKWLPQLCYFICSEQSDTAVCEGGKKEKWLFHSLLKTALKCIKQSRRMGAFLDHITLLCLPASQHHVRAGPQPHCDIHLPQNTGLIKQRGQAWQEWEFCKGPSLQQRRDSCLQGPACRNAVGRLLWQCSALQSERAEWKVLIDELVW